jgi:hypothetical protein
MCRFALLTAAAERSLDARWKASLCAAAEVASDVPVLADLVPVLESEATSPVVAARAALDIGGQSGKAVAARAAHDGRLVVARAGGARQRGAALDGLGRAAVDPAAVLGVADGGASVPASAGVAGGTHVQPRGPAAVVLEATLEVGRRLRPGSEAAGRRSSSTSSSSTGPEECFPADARRRGRRCTASSR